MVHLAGGEVRDWRVRVLKSPGTRGLQPQPSHDLFESRLLRVEP